MYKELFYQLYKLTTMCAKNVTVDISLRKVLKNKVSCVYYQSKNAFSNYITQGKIYPHKVAPAVVQKTLPTVMVAV